MAPIILALRSWRLIYPSRSFAAAAICLTVLSASIQAQRVQPVNVGPVQKARQEYLDAYDAWSKGERANIEKDISTAPTPELVKRIAAEAGRTQRLLTARQSFFQALGASMTNHLTEIKARSNPNPEEMKTSIQRQLSDVVEAGKVVEQELKSTTSPLLQRSLEQQQKYLQDIERSLVRQQVLMDRTKEADASVEASRAKVEESLQRLKESIVIAEEQSKLESTNWKTYFDTLVAQAKQPRGSAGGGKGGPAGGVTAGVGTAGGAGSGAGTGAGGAQPGFVQPSLAGTWVLRPGAGSGGTFAASGVTLEIKESGDQLFGTFSGKYQVGKNDFPSNVRIEFTGERGAKKYNFHTGNLSGMIELFPGGPAMEIILHFPEKLVDKKPIVLDEILKR